MSKKLKLGPTQSVSETGVITDTGVMGRRCQCEDSNHLLSLPPHDPDHPTHPYTDLFYNLEPVKTAYGTLLMCPACAEHARKDGR
jgi:hypothetical protein